VLRGLLSARALGVTLGVGCAAGDRASAVDEDREQDHAVLYCEAYCAGLIRCEVDTEPDRCLEYCIEGAERAELLHRDLVRAVISCVEAESCEQILTTDAWDHACYETTLAAFEPPAETVAYCERIAVSSSGRRGSPRL
jgi:hypothetical protein